MEYGWRNVKSYRSKETWTGGVGGEMGGKDGWSYCAGRQRPRGILNDVD